MSEKRQFFRIQQDVIFDYKCVNTDAVTHISAEHHFDHANSLGLFTRFQQFDNDTNPILENIRESNSGVAEYLEMLNQKVNLLSQQILSHEAVAAHDSESGQIDLSQGGIGFNAPINIGVETWVALKLVFLPSYTGLVTYAQVTRTQLLEDGNYLIGARFHQLNNEQHKIIARQVMQTQLFSQRQKKSAVHH